MARLNEASVPMESHLEILRRKFLRQNRDIARINSDQSQKIRRLENDCARLLSENLELRSRILRLEKQLEDGSARRIADHALEVKARLEAQLADFAALLGSLGSEPPAKRRASGEGIRARSRPSAVAHRSPPPHRRRRETPAEAEASAEQEGRLPPIFENKTYPRATMSTEEILALCAAAEDENESPDLGPPPISRYADGPAEEDEEEEEEEGEEEEEEPVKQPRPSPEPDRVPESPVRSMKLSTPPKLDYNRKPLASPEPTKEADEIVVQEPTPAEPKPAPALEPSPPPVRAGAKRKYGDENGPTRSVGAGKENAAPTEKRGGQKSQGGLAEAAGGKPERKTKTPLGPKRTPLAAKSTNDDMLSPRKATNGKPLTKEKQDRAGKDGGATRRLKLDAVVLPDPPAAAEMDCVLPSAAPSSPATPDRPAQEDVQHDTPPPADISSTGQTARPTRRTRPAISYAEPNLRDKMRRPTKELFDAVTGEGKYAHRLSLTLNGRASVSSADDHPAAAPASSGSKPRAERGSSVAGGSHGKPSSSAAGDASSSSKTQQQQEQQAPTSPLAQKKHLSELLPSGATVTERRRKRPSAAPVEGAVPSEPAPPAREPDIYDFTASSPAPPPPPTTTTTTLPMTKKTTTSSSSSSSVSQPSSDTAASASSEPAARPARAARKSSMAAAAALRHILDDEDNSNDDAYEPSGRAGARSRPGTTAAGAAAGGSVTRKSRASMSAVSLSRRTELAAAAAAAEADEDVDMEADVSGTSIESGGGSGEVEMGAAGRRGGRVVRRRSMMI
ncbi:hypothetical protein VTJ83DRAFT_6487 [Remersonia thermophila]|uniref:Shugoshin C-terminal domain-containing protein n=1 Tax=Remersonia thermophila TaxID=72144 RepID=A0ABR4D4U6_9PEZI